MHIGAELFRAIDQEAAAAKTGFEVGENVVDPFDADRKADEPRGDARSELLFGSELRVRRRRGVDDE